LVAKGRAENVERLAEIWNLHAKAALTSASTECSSNQGLWLVGDDNLRSGCPVNGRN
jgi:hypothetical protein